jgi:hypothetical protein
VAVDSFGLLNMPLKNFKKGIIRLKVAEVVV